MQRFLRQFLSAILPAVLLFAAAPEAYAQFVLSQEVVDKQVEGIVAQYRKIQSWDGSFSYAGQYKVGTTALVLYALASAGYTEEDKMAADALGYLLKNRSTSTYEEGLVICALERLDRIKYKARIESAHNFLVNSQIVNGGWGYGDYRVSKTYADESCSQYAVLGLASAANGGIPMPEQTELGAKRFYASRQKNDGGWGYNSSQSTFSMTSAGLASFRMLGEKLETPIPGRCGGYKVNPNMEKGFRWLARNTHSFMNTFHMNKMYGYYALYGFERVCILNDLKEVGGMDWYRDGCINILRNGQWRTDIVSTSFVLLFIARNSAPYAVTKWKWNGRWNPDKYDVANWTKHVSELIKKPLDYQTAELGTREGNPGLSSMIFVSGHGEFSAAPEAVAELRKYLKDGGILVAEACCSDPTFLKSFTAFMETKLNPDTPQKFVNLHPAHPLFSSRYKLDPSKVRIKALKRGCGASQVFLLGQEISCALNGDEVDPQKKKDALETASNLMIYALGKRKPKAKFDPMLYSALSVDTLLNEKIKPGSGLIYNYRNPLGRIKHGGVWNTDPGFSKQLVQSFEKNPDLPAFDTEVPVDPESAEIFACPLLILTGHGAPLLSPKAVANLKRYLANGGKLIMEACCADTFFQNAADSLITVLNNGKRPEIIPADSPLYRNPYPISPSGIETTQAWKNIYGSAMPAIYGIRSASGGWSVIYIPYDVSCAFDGDLEENIPALKQKSASELLANVIHALLAETEAQ